MATGKKPNRIINISFWDDATVADKFSAEDKYFYLYLLTNPHTTQLGIYELPVSKAENETGLSRDTVYVLFDRFENQYDLIRRDPDTCEIAIKNYLRHAIAKGGTPVMELLISELQKVKNLEHIGYIYNNLNNHKDELNKTVIEFLEYLSINYSNIIINYSNISNNNNSVNTINDNDNVGRIVHESSTNRKNREKSTKTNEKEIFGEYRNVLLTAKEYSRLAEDFSEEVRDEAITFLDEYIEEKSYKSKSHYLAIRRWVIDAVNDKSGRKSNKQNTNEYLLKQAGMI